MRINRMLVAVAVVAGSMTAVTFASSAGASNKMPDAGVPGCDRLVATPTGHDCLLPWPNDAFTKPSTSTRTRRVLNIPSTLTPTNVSGVHIDTKYENLNDGFSPGSTPLIQIPNLSDARYQEVSPDRRCRSCSGTPLQSAACPTLPSSTARIPIRRRSC